LGLSDKMNVERTPVMPEFIKIDPLDLKTSICTLDGGSLQGGRE
jgi:hypothetical protein